MSAAPPCKPDHGNFETPPDLGSGGVSNFAGRQRNPRKSAVSETGTAFAINNINSGVAALSAGGTGRGGARNRADRESTALTSAQIENLKGAERHAEKIGLPFTRMITIHWQAAGVPLAGMAKATHHFLDLLTKTLARHGSGAAWLWVHENARGPSNDKGGHCHLLVYVPGHLVPVVARLQRGWLRRITGQPYQARVILSKPIGGRLGLEVGNPHLHAANVEAVMAYVLKGASPEAAAQFGLERLEQGGRVIGKRCGTSQNIGPAARRTHVGRGWLNP